MEITAIIFVLSVMINTVLFFECINSIVNKRINRYLYIPIVLLICVSLYCGAVMLKI